MTSAGNYIAETHAIFSAGGYQAGPPAKNFGLTAMGRTCQFLGPLQHNPGLVLREVARPITVIST